MSLSPPSSPRRNEIKQVTTETKGDKKKTLCGSCESELEPDHPGIQCIQGHHFCTECSKQIVSLFFSEPQHYIPLRCVQCHVELNVNVFERQLTPEQLDFYHQNMLVLVWAKEILAPDERLDNCPFCSFAVIRSIYDPNIFYCERPDCRKTSCLICRKACPKFLSDYASELEQAEMIRHFTCAELANDKYAFDQAIEGGQKVPCPKCGLAGMKDDSCTHMTCPTCFQVWCYFCGKKLEDCDRSQGGTNGIIDHNHNWDRNPNRCPMYMTQIQDLDDRWPDDEEQCLIMFHRNRSLRLLREIFELLGRDRIDELNRHFHTLDSCGFTLDEILREDLTLIAGRDRHRRYQRRPE
jgi:TRIAD3 protein (E3 ubiquitin-protein ligase RNF216)